MAASILGNLSAARPDEDRAALLARMSPDERRAYLLYGAGRDLTRGAGVLAGADVRTPAEKQRGAVEAVKEQVAKLGLDPEKPETVDRFYREVVRILQSQGFAAEALEVSKEYQAQKLAQQKETRMGEQSQANIAAGRGRLELAAKRLELDEQRAEAVGPKAVVMIRQLKNMQDQLARLPENSPQRETVLSAIENLKNALEAELATKNFELKDAGNRLVVFNKATGEVGDSVARGARPEQDKDKAKREKAAASEQAAYDQFKVTLQADYDAVTELYNHPGLSLITGPVAGLGAGDPEEKLGREASISARGGNAQAANNLVKRVKASAFVNAIRQMKQQSASGATGLGAVSNIEGGKLQAAIAGLSTTQPTDSFRENLKKFRDLMVASATILDSKAEQMSLTLRPLTEKPLAAPGAAKPAPRQPAAAPTRRWTAEEVK